jgi:dTDP-4-dehydrorhamnose 3,5-epimerase
MIKPIITDLGGVLLIVPDIHEDFRGQYVETYNAAEYKRQGIDVDFVQDDISISSKGVLRGIHGDFDTWKLVSCLEGRFYLVVVDCRKDGEFGAWDSFLLTESNHHQVLIPPGYGNGHLALTERIIFHYKQSTYYNRAKQFTYRWDDPRFEIAWPTSNPILSERDAKG